MFIGKMAMEDEEDIYLTPYTFTLYVIYITMLLVFIYFR